MATTGAYPNNSVPFTQPSMPHATVTNTNTNSSLQTQSLHQANFQHHQPHHTSLQSSQGVSTQQQHPLHLSQPPPNQINLPKPPNTTTTTTTTTAPPTATGGLDKDQLIYQLNQQLCELNGQLQEVQ